MKERPIIFSGGGVRAILDGRKTQTRRVCRKEIWTLLDEILEYNGKPGWQCLDFDVACPFDVDRLWAREAFAYLDPDYQPTTMTDQGHVIPVYRADHQDPRGDGPANPMKWRPSIHMPRWASRITLEVTGVRVERLKHIRLVDAVAEGVCEHPPQTLGSLSDWPVDAFIEAWDALNAKRGYPWKSNPWVWCISFKRVEDE